MSVVECPKCQALVQKTFGCMSGHCICGADFCVKCLRFRDKFHSDWECFLSGKNDKISWFVILFCLYSLILLPFIPFCVIFIYWKNWDRNYFSVINERPGFYFFMIFLFSPEILIFAIFMLPFYWGWFCVEALLDQQETRGVFWGVLKILVYFPSVLLMFLGILLGLGTVVVCLPLLGIAFLFCRVNLIGPSGVELGN
jgi:hypothetical protein